MNPAVQVWCNGRLSDAGDVRISPFDHGLLVGDGVFETLRVYHGSPFAWTRHDARLRASASGLGLTVPDPATLRAAADAVLAANGLVDARLRITITGGPAPLGSERGDDAPTVIVAATQFSAWAPTVDVVIAPWTRNEQGAVAGLKTISYAANVRALAYATERGAGEALFANTSGNLCEATGSNVFVIRDGVARTPPASAGCLLGVTRALILELCAANGIPAEEEDLPMGAVAECDEAFLTSTTREVHPVARVDGRELPAAPGPVTQRIAELFEDLVARDIDP
ncbi:MAG: aminotransferase class IV [Acidimicrobiia bacterium]